MPSFTTELASRTTRELPLTLAGASQMAEQAFNSASSNTKHRAPTQPSPEGGGEEGIVG